MKKSGATDAAAIQVTGSGVKVGTVSVPVRYIHAPVGMALKADIENTIALVSLFVETASCMRSQA